MRITPLRSVRIENFRSIRHVEIELHPEVTVLFGANAAGKTTVLDAIAIVLGALPARVPKVTGRDFAKSGDLRVPWKDRETERERRGVECAYARVSATATGGLSWDVTRLRSQQDRQYAPSGAGTRALHEVLDPAVREALDARPGAVTQPLPLVAAYGTERAVVELPLRERDFAKDFQRFAGLDQSLRATTRFKTVFEWFRLMEDEERREGKGRGDFDFELPELQWVRRALQKAELRCKNPRVETKPLRMLVDFEHEGGETEPLDISALSDGYRTHFSLVVDLARRMVQLNPSPDLDDPERGANTRGVVLIDEIDLHLDPPWQARVVRGLLSAFPNTQFVITTHSEQVVGSVQASSVRRLVWGDGEVRVEPVPFAQGASGERILIELMGAPERVEGPVKDKLEAYRTVVAAGEGQSDAGRSLRSELDSALGPDEALHALDLEMQRQSLMARLKGTPG